MTNISEAKTRNRRSRLEILHANIDEAKARIDYHEKHLKTAKADLATAEDRLKNDGAEAEAREKAKEEKRLAKIAKMEAALASLKAGK